MIVLIPFGYVFGERLVFRAPKDQGGHRYAPFLGDCGRCGRIAPVVVNRVSKSA